ncbi:hypothetical protein JMUB7512_27680 [Staphylococcus aureus]
MYKRQVGYDAMAGKQLSISDMMASQLFEDEYFMYGLQTYAESNNSDVFEYLENGFDTDTLCLLYTSPSPRDYAASRMPSSA